MYSSYDGRRWRLSGSPPHTHTHSHKHCFLSYNPHCFLFLVPNPFLPSIYSLLFLPSTLPHSLLLFSSIPDRVHWDLSIPADVSKNDVLNFSWCSQTGRKRRCEREGMSVRGGQGIHSLMCQCHPVQYDNFVMEQQYWHWNSHIFSSGCGVYIKKENI